MYEFGESKNIISIKFNIDTFYLKTDDTLEK